MKSSFYLATKNANKLREVRRILHGAGITVKPCPRDVVFPEETGATFEENAFLKAAHLKKITGGEFVAGEDSGLAVEKLNGLPGVFSARFAGGGDAENIKKLLEMLSSYKDNADRKAKFVTVIVLLYPSGRITFTGEVEGIITFSPRGANGFGYDPVFEIEGTGRTFAELSAEEKNAASHRSIAFRKLAEYLLKL
jgi:XTP/dITP diphosphohydrolase